MKAVLNIAKDWVTLIASVLCILVVVWRGGAIEEQVKGHEVRLTNMEHAGSVAVQSHITEDAERHRAVVSELTDLKSAMKSVAEMQADIREIRARVEMLTKVAGK